MATLISGATGNFTAAGTWFLCDATSESDSEANSTASTTSFVASSVFTPGVITINAIAIKLATRPAATGTFTIELFNNTLTASVTNTSTTVNVSDMDSAGNGWYVFPTNGNVTLVGATGYAVRIKSSVAGEVTLYRDGTAGNWTRQLRTTTTQAPAANDKLLVYGEHTGAGTGNSLTVTMDNTATTSFGPTVSGGPPQGMSIGKRGTLTFGTTASTNYYLKLKGILAVYGGATLNIGTSGTRMPSSGSAILEFDSAANVDSGLNIFPGSTFNAYGDNARAVSTLMTADKAAAATVITLAATTGWAVSDTLCFASTTRTAADCESKIISTVDSSTQVTLTAGLTNAHSGTSPTQAEVGNLTRNVKIRGVSASLCGYVVFQTTATVNVDYVEFTQNGSATASKRGIDVTTTTGTCSVTHCSIHDCTVASSIGFIISGSTSSGITFSNNVVYNVANAHFQVAVTSGTWTADTNLFVRNTDASQNLVILSDVGGTFTNPTMVGATGAGVQFNEAASILTASNITCHSNATGGITFNTVINNSTLAGTTTLWRNNSTGINLASSVNCLTIANIVAFGNLTNNIAVGSCGNILIQAATLSGDTTFSTASGITISNSTLSNDIVIESATFGVVTGINTAHTQDINVGSSPYATITLRNCNLASSTEVASQSNLQPGAYIRSQKHDQTAGLHKCFTKYGTLSIDTALFDVTPSVRLTPNNASNKLATDGGSVDGKGSFRVPVANGGTVTVSVKVRKSVAGDGTAYNGALPRLIVRKNVAAGIAADTVLATATSASVGAFETISGSTTAVTDDAILSFVIDADGTTGWVNHGLPTATVSVSSGSAGAKYWLDGEPHGVGGGNPFVVRGMQGGFPA